jgi:hypothetical protein
MYSAMALSAARREGQAVSSRSSALMVDKKSGFEAAGIAASPAGSGAGA